MLDEPVRRVMRRRKFLKASPRTFVARAAKLMATKGVGALLVLEDDRLVGIFTERDIVFRVVAAALDPATTRLQDVMTRDPQTVDDDKPFGCALVLMHQGGFRHLPVLRDGRPVGIVSARSALDPDLEEFASEAYRRRYFTRLR